MAVNFGCAIIAALLLMQIRQSVKEWLTTRLAAPAVRPQATSRRAQTALICAAIFMIAVGVRLLHWQDLAAEIARGEPWMADLVRQYKSDAQYMLEGNGILFPRDQIDPGDARLLVHPPGYSMLMAAVFALSDHSNSAVRWVQIVADALSVLMVFLIALELLNSAIATIAGLLAALSPHFAFYSLWLSPDTLPVLPVLAAVYFVIKASKRPRLIWVIAAGALIGVSCWLRANALMLAPFLAVAVMMIIGGSKRWRYGLALVAATVAVIAPLTIRNAILFHRFIPVSIAGGENLVVGIGDVDKEGRFDMPTSDADATRKDVEWHNRPDYADSLWVPDGIERDQYRYGRGLKVIGAHPFWFGGVMIRRAAFMLNYNNAGRADWPFNTATVPLVATEPPVARSLADINDAPPVSSVSAADLLVGDIRLAEQANISFVDDDQTLRIAGDASEFADQFAAAPIGVKPKTDYALRLEIAPEQGAVAVKVTGEDRRITLTSTALDAPTVERSMKRRAKRENPGSVPDEAASRQMSVIEMGFASGDRSAVRLVISNNGRAALPRVVRIGQSELFELGATPYQWTRYPRAMVRGVQKGLFKTRVMLPLVLVGAVLLCIAGRGRALVVLLAVPVYYLGVQSALSTEYRYILAIHYFLFVLSAAALYCAGAAIGSPLRGGWRRMVELLAPRRSRRAA
jgi:Dolichyl-phosphate-mannose-protein mannosyltransferase